MNDEHDPRFEKLLGRKLRGLPDRTAPAAIRATVLAAIRARAGRPWYQRSWFQWPRAFQATSAVLVLALVLALGWLAPGHGLTLATLSPALSERLSEVASQVGWFTSFLAAFVRAVPAAWWMATAGVFAGLAFTCAGLGSAFYRFVILELRQERP